MKTAFCILAKNEERTIRALLQAIAGQSLLRDPEASATIFVVANGCTDRTAAEAEQVRAELAAADIELRVIELAEGGKSRSWNKAVHEFIQLDHEFIFFVDSDITLLRPTVFEELLTTAGLNPQAVVISGHPLKDVAAKRRKSLVDQFSLSVSERGRYDRAINGSLYLVKAKDLADVWLPNFTPAEDGFLNAMISTRGFSRPADEQLVCTVSQPTHLFRAHGLSSFVAHERRMIVATTINSWIFEHLWALQLTEPAGPLIDRWNRERPDWVEAIIRERSHGRAWLVPSEIMLLRMKRIGHGSWARRLAYVPLATAATLLTLVPAIAANGRLKREGAANTW